MKFLTVLVIAVCLSLAASMMSYHGHRLVSITVQNQQQLKVLKAIERNGEPWLDFWSPPGVNRTADVRVPPASFGMFMQMMRRANIPVRIVENDVEEFLQVVSKPKILPKISTSPHQAWAESYVEHTYYRRYNEIVSIMNGLKETFGNIVKEVGEMNRETVGHRKMHYIRLGTGTNKPVIFIESLIHAREWIAGGAILYTMDRLCSSYAYDSDARNILDNFEIYIVPVANPDGYEYSHTDNRMWRKNRATGPGNCNGVDLNRNFDVDWGNEGVSHNCRSDTYCGTGPFSEIESQNIRDLVNQINAGGSKLLAYLAVHSYSQLLLTPFSYDYVKPNNSAEIEYLAAMMNDAMREPFNTDYQWGHGPPTLYAVSGASDDWAMVGAGARYVYTYELQPATYDPGFILGPEFIIPNGYEFWRSLVTLAENISY